MDQGNKAKRIIATVLAIVALVLVAAVGFVGWNKVEADRAARERHSITLPLTATPFDTSTGSKLPVCVTGPNADDLIQKADDKRSQAIADKQTKEKQEEEARQKAERQRLEAAKKARYHVENTKKAHYHVENKYFIFDAPEYWYDCVTIQSVDTSISVDSKKCSNRRIAPIYTSMNYISSQSFVGWLTYGDDGTRAYMNLRTDYGQSGFLFFRHGFYRCRRPVFGGRSQRAG